MDKWLMSLIVKKKTLANKCESEQYKINKWEIYKLVIIQLMQIIGKVDTVDVQPCK